MLNVELISGKDKTNASYLQIFSLVCFEFGMSDFYGFSLPIGKLGNYHTVKTAYGQD
jgi:hypothetical protein